MTKKLEEEFNLRSLSELEDDHEEVEEEYMPSTITEVTEALTLSEKIEGALNAIKGIDTHDSDMDDIALKAIESYQNLMDLGLNVSDRDAGPIFDNAAKMLKTALEAKDSKVNTKLKQIDLMIKKARLDQQVSKGKDEDDDPKGGVFDRNELLKLINKED